LIDEINAAALLAKACGANALQALGFENRTNSFTWTKSYVYQQRHLCIELLVKDIDGRTTVRFSEWACNHWLSSIEEVLQSIGAL
jgi:hypothetical protein